MSLIKRFLFIFLILITGLNCENTDDRVYIPPPTHPPPGQHLPHMDGCQFYKVQSLIINCYEEQGFFTKIGEQRDIIASVCISPAFLQVFGVSINPSLPQQGNNEDSWFRWWFVFGNIRAGNPPPSYPPHPLEIGYVNFLNQFQNSLDAGRLNQCLGGNYPFPGPEIINTAHEMIKLSMLEAETFVRCYREQMEQYGIRVCNATVTPQNP